MNIVSRTNLWCAARLAPVQSPDHTIVEAGGYLSKRERSSYVGCIGSIFIRVAVVCREIEESTRSTAIEFGVERKRRLAARVDRVLTVLYPPIGQRMSYLERLV